MYYERKYKEARILLQEWTDKQGHERCHYYPEIFRKLCDVLEVEPILDPALPLRNEFEEGCRRYQNEEYSKIEDPRQEKFGFYDSCRGSKKLN